MKVEYVKYFCFESLEMAGGVALAHDPNLGGVRLALF